MAKPHIHCSIFRQKFMINISFEATPFSSYLLISCSAAVSDPDSQSGGELGIQIRTPLGSVMSQLNSQPSSLSQYWALSSPSYIKSFSFPQETFNLIFFYNLTLEYCYLLRLPLDSVSFIKATPDFLKFP